MSASSERESLLTLGTRRRRGVGHPSRRRRTKVTVFRRDGRQRDGDQRRVRLRGRQSGVGRFEDAVRAGCGGVGGGGERGGGGGRVRLLLLFVRRGGGSEGIVVDRVFGDATVTTLVVVNDALNL